ncbi:HNH endonuclease [Mycobacterium marinum]|uniref:HNH endonuclease n=1 Tax=Mycobacterium marinum TaxID=1781 RepID=UPI000B97029E|nr:HNH endonuclease [Mycobacterium marinum]
MTEIDDHGLPAGGPVGRGGSLDGLTIPLRGPCPCGGTEGRIKTKNGQDTVWCSMCGTYAGFNATRAETGRPRRVLRTHRKISASQRARIFLRDRSMCVLCGRRENLVMGHAVSLRDGYADGLSDALLYCDANLVALCAECNAGLGGNSIPPHRLLLIFALRAQRQRDR